MLLATHVAWADDATAVDQSPAVTLDYSKSGTVALSLADDTGENEQKFLFLQGRAGALNDSLPDGTVSQLGYVTPSTAGPGLGPDFSGLLRQIASSGQDSGAAPSLLTNETLQIGYFTPRYAGLLFGFGSHGDADGDRGFGVSISSNYYLGAFGVEGPPVFDLSDLNRTNHAYNFGLNVGLAGFTLGASYLRGEREFDFGYRGFDFGLMYEGRTWATSLQFAEYTQQRDDLFFGTIDSDKVYSLEFGASYTFGFGLTLAGRLQYYDYGSGFLRDEIDDAQVFFLGSHLSF